MLRTLLRSPCSMTTERWRRLVGSIGPCMSPVSSCWSWLCRISDVFSASYQHTSICLFFATHRDMECFTETKLSFLKIPLLLVVNKVIQAEILHSVRLEHIAFYNNTSDRPQTSVHTDVKLEHWAGSSRLFLLWIPSGYYLVLDYTSGVYTSLRTSGEGQYFTSFVNNRTHLRMSLSRSSSPKEQSICHLQQQDVRWHGVVRNYTQVHG